MDKRTKAMIIVVGAFLIALILLIAWGFADEHGVDASIDGERLCWLKPMTELQVFWWTKEWCVTTRGMIRTEFLKEDPCHES